MTTCDGRSLTSSVEGRDVERVKSVCIKLLVAFAFQSPPDGDFTGSLPNICSNLPWEVVDSNVHGEDEVG